MLPRPIGLAIVVVVSCTTAARSQIGHSAPSLEWLVASSERIVIAKVDTVDRGPSGGQQQPLCWSTVTLKVVEPLKGKPGPPPGFVEYVYEFNRIHEGWRNGGQSYVFFLGKNDQFGLPGDPNYAPSRRLPLVLIDVIAMGPPVPEEKGFLPRPPGRMTMDLVALSDPKEIVRFVRAAVAYKDDRASGESHLITLPRHIMQRTGRSSDANVLSVPVDRRLETLARRLINSPDTFLGSRGPLPGETETRRKQRASWRASEASRLRVEGIEALAFFKSAENIVGLRTMLDDPSCTFRIREAPVGPPFVEPDHEVRAEANAVLKQWGEAVREPAMKQRVKEK